jgi:histidinol-phosphate phosphatase family protein
VSNQSGVARGYFGVDALERMEAALASMLACESVPVDGFYWCPHLLEGSISGYAVACDCRKPRPGLITRAAHELNLDLKESWMAGDILDDVEAGRRAGCRSALVDSGHETEWRFGPLRVPDVIVADLAQLARYVCDFPASRIERRGSLSGAGIR